MTAQQLSLFQQGEDLPLFSGTPQRAKAEQPKDPSGAYKWINDAPDWPANFGISSPAILGGFRDTGERHTYGDNGTYLQVSDAAADEKDRRWHEIVGWADGYAKVDHPDWHALYEFMLRTCPYMVNCYPDPAKWGPSFLIIVKRPSGKLAFAGSICRRDGQIELNG